MECRTFGSGITLSATWAKRVLVCSLATLVGCGAAGDSQEESVASFSAQLTLTDPAIPLATTLPPAADPLAAGLVVPADAPQKGMWSTTQPWPLNGLHSVLLPNGKVLTFGTPLGDAATQDGRSYDVWDPTKGFGSGRHQRSFEVDRVSSLCGP